MVVGPFNTPDATTQAPQADTPKAGLAGFLATTAGKIVIGGAIVVIIGLILTVIAFVFIFNAATDIIVNTPGDVVVTTQTAETDVASQRRDPRLSDTFAFRNIFAPTVKPSAPPSESVDATSLVPTDLPLDTLFLASIATVDGQPVGTFFWNGAEFQAGEGDVLIGTPWKVISLDGNTAVMLYGDSQVTLTVGQGSSK
ncbi:MAG: hypothetical protein U1E26_05710 [Coriobacteriia bacterium]|nr:hypothetical protein [Coriobacteriia bacterium]